MTANRSLSPRLAPRPSPRIRVALAALGFVCLTMAVAAMEEPRDWRTVRPLFTSRPEPGRPFPDAPPTGPQGIVPRAPVGDAERRVFGALAPGARVGQGTVVALEGIRDGFLRVHVASNEGPLELWIARLAGTNARPPVSVGPYAIYCAPTAIPHERLEPTMRAVAAALDADPAHVPPPLRPLRAERPAR